MQRVLEKIFIRFLSLKRNSKAFLIGCFLISFFTFDLSKAESDNSNFKKIDQPELDHIKSKKVLGDITLDPERKTFNNKNINNIGIEYIKSKRDLEDYIIDTGDTLFIQFENKPRGFNSFKQENQNELDPNDLSYLDPKNDLNNYILDEGDVINITFKNIPKGDPELLKKNHYK